MSLSWRGKQLRIEEISWKDIRETVRHHDPYFAELIDGIGEKSISKIYKARYAYGNHIVDHGKFHLPLEDNTTVPLTDVDIPLTLQNNLGAKTVPVSFILSKSVEVFFEAKHYVVPSKLCGTGYFFGLWEAFDPIPNETLSSSWHLTAGARTICMLPSIADAIHYRRLQREFQLKKNIPPSHLLEQHQLFTALSRHIDEPSLKWECEILLFSDDWTKNEKLYPIKTYLLQQAWHQSYNCRSKMDYDIGWDTFNEEITQRNWKPKAYSIAIIKHILAVYEGIYPSFIPAYNDDAAPIAFLQRCFLDIYKLKDYAPYIMHLAHFNHQRTHYFSLALPTQFDHPPTGRNKMTIANRLGEIKRMLELLCGLNFSQLDTGYFHCDDNFSHEIKSSHSIISDAQALTWHNEQFNGLKFPHKSQFFKGCISIDRK